MTGLMAVVILALAVGSFARARKATDPDARRLSRLAGTLALFVALAMFAYTAYEAFYDV